MDLIVEFVLPVSTNIGSARLVASVLGKGLFLSEDRVELLCSTLTWNDSYHLVIWAAHAIAAVKVRITMLVEVTDSNF